VLWIQGDKSVVIVQMKFKEVRYTFCCSFLSKLEDYEVFTVNILSDEATFRLLGNVD
jgi:hypothetical protein